MSLTVLRRSYCCNARHSYYPSRFLISSTRRITAATSQPISRRTPSLTPAVGAVRTTFSSSAAAAVSSSSSLQSLQSSCTTPAAAMRFVCSRPHQTVPIFFLTTAAVLSFRPISTTQADNNAVGTTRTQQLSPPQQDDDKSCPYYGCSLLPTDVHYSPDEIKQAFAQMRATKRNQHNVEAMNILQKSVSADSTAVTLTLIGYKGGQLQEQVNQDRSFVLSPYSITTTTTTTTTTQQQQDASQQMQTSNNNILQQDRILLGVFDGHAPLGELVSEYTATELPKLLAQKLRDAFEDYNHADNDDNLSFASDDDSDDDDDDGSIIMDLTKRALHETFVQLDKTAPADPSGGCTATVVLKQGAKIYIANAGDSRSFIVTYRPSTGLSEIVYMTREDKPDLPEEKARVEAAGGQVYIPARGTSRVVYQDPNTGAPTGLAMSRSIGDWAAGRMGVIPDPVVHVLDIDTLVNTQLYGMDGTAAAGAAATVDAATGNVVVTDDDDGIVDDVYVFAVSATDGMMDYLHEAEIANILSHALFADTGIHPVSACEHLVFAAAQGWQEAKSGRYRDDIAIAVSALRQPPHVAATAQAAEPAAQ